MKYFYLLISINWMQCDAALRVLGGRDALIGEFPYIIRLEFHLVVSKEKEDHIYGAQLCTGAALTSTWILTAAHCYFPTIYENPEYKVLARYSNHFPNDYGKISRILEFLQHPGYIKTGLATAMNDIGLCRSERLSITEFAKISAINYGHLIGQVALTLGYGGTNSSEFKTPLQVLQGMLTKCQEMKYSTKRMICLVPKCGLVATICGGDSGGPIVHPSGIIGVNSMSIDDCDHNTKIMVRTPGTAASIIALVGPRIDWISNVIRNKTGLS